MIKEIRRNIFDTKSNIIIHGCNYQGKMNAGIAKQIRKLYPKAYSEYINHYNKYGLKLGEIISVPCINRWIINIITQKYYGNDGKKYTDYTAIRSCFKRVKVTFRDYSQGLCLGGVVLEGGDWDIVKNIIKEELDNFEVLVYYM